MAALGVEIIRMFRIHPWDRHRGNTQLILSSSRSGDEMLFVGLRTDVR
jgi:hypothetical protein